MDRAKQTNLFKANSVETTDKPFIKKNILKSVKYALTDYVNYINKNIRLVQENGTITIPLKELETRYYIRSSKEKKTIKEQVLKNNLKTIVVNNEGAIKVNSYNEKDNFFIVKTDKKIKTIAIKLDGKNIPLKYETAIAYTVQLDKLNDKETKKVETELFEKNNQDIFTEKPSDNEKKNKKIRASIKAINVKDKTIVLNSTEKLEFIYLKEDDSQLRKQLDAIKILRDNPRKEHTPLQKLFDPSNTAIQYFEENVTHNNPKPYFEILNDLDIDGVDQQQKFVNKALKTKDFALLEGPPGSGKTTAIIELIIQLIKQNKRVLLVSATHVAVDNVIHRILKKYKKQCEGLVVPLRIASDITSIRKKSVEPYELKTFIKKTKEEITKNIRTKNINESGKLLLENIYTNNNVFDDIILKSANLVGGTMIGILQHPDIQKGGIQEMFDVMIVDESSKVTFSEFIVPALHAKKWILVGDVNQLSPYTEEYFINENIDAIIKDKQVKEKIAAAYTVNQKLYSTKRWDKESVKILFSMNHNENDFADYEVFKIPTNFEVNNINILTLNSVDLIICEPTRAHKKIISDYVYVKAHVFENKIDLISFKNRQKYFHKNTGKNKNFSTHKFEFISDKKQDWKELVGSNLSQMYQYRLDEKSNAEYKKEFEFLVPNEFQKDVEKIRRIAMPSILELLQIGVGNPDPEDQSRQLIYKGFKGADTVISNKFQTLSYQHRMEDEIASISREHFYDNENLKTANTVSQRTNILDWYKPNDKKVIWITNKYRNKSKKIVNHKEVEQIKFELEAFIEEAKYHPKQDNNNYEIAVLSFYNDQVAELKKMLRSLSNKFKENKIFTINNVEITLSTVDKFQGDEADMVLLSFTKSTKKAHYNSPNRLNVALTRARFKLILYGNKDMLTKNAQLEALRKIANKIDGRLNN